MGNEQIKPSIAHSTEWTFIREIKSHPLFGHIKVYKGPADQLQCLKTVIVEESQYKDQMDSLKKMIVKDVLSQNQPNCSSLICINRLETQKQEEFCSNYVKIYLTADYSDQPIQQLKDPFQQWINKEQTIVSFVLPKSFNLEIELKLLYLLFTITLISNMKYQSYCNTQLFTEISDYEQLYFNEVSKDDWMIAPEVMNSLKVNCPPSFNSESAVIFNFGIMMINLLTGVHPKDASIYDYKNLALKDNLSSYAHSIEQLQIPTHIKQLIQDCVNVKPTLRPTFKMITNSLLSIATTFPLNKMILTIKQIEIPLQVSQIKNEELPTNQIFNPCYEDVKKVLSESHVNKNLNFHNESPQKIDKQQFMTDTQQSAQFRKSKQIYNLENAYNSRASIQQKQCSTLFLLTITDLTSLHQSEDSSKGIESEKPKQKAQTNQGQWESPKMILLYNYFIFKFISLSSPMSDYQIKYQEIKGSLALLLQQNYILKQQLKEATQEVQEKQQLKEEWASEVQRVQETIHQLSYDNQNYQQENEQLSRENQESQYVIEQQIEQITTLKQQNEKLIVQLDESRQQNLQKEITIKQQRDEFNKQLEKQQSQHYEEIKKLQGIIDNQSGLIQSYEKLNEIEKLDTQNSFYQQQMAIEDQMIELKNRNIILTNKINEEKQKYDQLYEQHKDEVTKLQGVVKDQKELQLKLRLSLFSRKALLQIINLKQYWLYFLNMKEQLKGIKSKCNLNLRIIYLISNHRQFHNQL